MPLSVSQGHLPWFIITRNLLLIAMCFFSYFSRIAKLEPFAPKPDTMPIEEAPVYEPCDEITLQMNHPVRITGEIRRDLVIWLVELCNEHAMNAEPAHLTVSYIDRFTPRAIRESNVKLLGLTALFIAAKKEEIEIEMADLLELCHYFYARDEVLEMESKMAKYTWMCRPTSLSFVNKFDMTVCLPLDVKAMSQYLVDLALVESRGFLGCSPSSIAAAAIAVARTTLDSSLWSVQMKEATGYNIDQLRNPIIALSEIQFKPFEGKSCAIYRQYSSEAFKCVSKVEPFIVSGFTLDQITLFASRYNSEEDSTSRDEMMSELSED